MFKASHTREHFPLIESLTDETLASAHVIGEDAEKLEELYNTFIDTVLNAANQKIKREYGINYANKKVDRNKLLFDKKDSKKFVKYMIEYFQHDKSQIDLKRAQLVLDSEGTFAYNHLLSEKLMDSAAAVSIIGGNDCGRCQTGIFYADELPGIPPYHAGCLCHIGKFYMKEKDIPEEDRR